MMETECKAPDNTTSLNNLTITNGSELLGSVTQQPDSEGGIQLRTSARVSKKLKLDSLAQALTEKKEIHHEEEKKAEVPAPVESKPRAKRVDWSAEDKVTFFEALNEYGKDIDAIHNYLVQKSKRRGGIELKTKDQVRFFYYRMCSILSKHISFPSYIKKQTQELYALINFGELRKKVSFSNKKHYDKLSEMIYSGSTQLKFRGKVRKVRTPLCKALRKLNQIEESSEELKLPTCVTVELRPRHTEDWCRVQALAQNPRVRSVLQLHRRLESLLIYLQHRWQTDDQKFKEQLLRSVGESSEEDEAEKWVLHVGPKPGTHITEPSVRLSEVATSSKLSLMAYEDRFHPNCKEVSALLHQLPVIQHRNKGRGVKRPRTDSLSEKTSAKEAEDIAVDGAVAVENGKTAGQDLLESAAIHLPALNCITDNAQTEMISHQMNGEQATPVKEPSGTASVLCAGLERVHSGWTLSTAGTIRIGDIYMMFGFDAKIHLDYWWERSSTCALPAAVSINIDEPVTAPANTASSQDSTPPTLLASYNSLTATLKKLLSVAKLELSKPKNSSSTHLGSDNKVSTSKSRISKPKTQPEPTQKLDPTQLKFQVRPLPLDEVFRKPIMAPINPLIKLDSLGIDKMRPRYCNRRGRPRRHNSTQRNIPQRVVPLLPKVPPALNILPKAQPVSLFSAVTKQGFKPIAPAPSAESKAPPISIDVKVAPVASKLLVPILKSDEKLKKLVGEPNPVANDRAPSPPSLSNLLDDLSLPSNCSSRLSTPVPSFEGLLGNNEENLSSTSKDQWISSEVTDLSLSGFSFLNNLDTDIKNITDDSRLSDMDSQLRTLMGTENSSDLNDIIADLTATIKTDTDPQ